MPVRDRVLVVAAHADDEALGCGGTIARHSDQGDAIDILFLADGESSRQQHTADANRRRRAAACDAAKILGAAAPHFVDLPDQELDRVGLLRLTQIIEQHASELKPTVVYTHHYGDLNEDHRLVSTAVLTAFRPVPSASVRAIYGFEVLSSSEWRFGARSNAFQPSRFLSIAEQLPRKLEALRAYHREMRDFPHPRSYKAVEAQSALRGAQVGLEAAEAFTIYRDVLR